MGGRTLCQQALLCAMPAHEGDRKMATVPPYHSTKPNTSNVHHNNNGCTEGNNIERMYLASGTAGRPLCDHCKRLAGK